MATVDVLSCQSQTQGNTYHVINQCPDHQDDLLHPTASQIIAKHIVTYVNKPQSFQMLLKIFVKVYIDQHTQYFKEQV